MKEISRLSHINKVEKIVNRSALQELIEFFRKKKYDSTQKSGSKRTHEME